MKTFNNIFRYYVFIFLVSFLPLVAFFSTSDVPHTHDGPVHLARMAAYYRALLDGQVLPRWAFDLNYQYGMPLFNFIYHTPYLLSSFFLFFGISLVTTFKIVLSMSYLLSALSMFAFSYALLEDKEKAMLVTIFYQFAPFRLVEILVRGSFGEVYTYAFLPLVLFGIVKLFTRRRPIYFIVTAFSTALLILSHNSISLIFFGVCLIFVFVFAQNKRQIVTGVSSLLSGLFLTAFYWLPAMAEHKFTYGDLFMKTIFRSHFPPFYQLMIPNFKNSELLQTGGIAVQIGLFHMFVTFAALHCAHLHRLFQKTSNKIIVFSFMLITASLFFMHPISSIFWERISFLRQFQFPWRLLSVISFATSLLAVSIYSYQLFRSRRARLALLALVVLSTAYYWKPPLGFDKIDEQSYWDYPLTTTFFGETDLIWSAGPAKSYPHSPAEIISGSGTITSSKRRSTNHLYIVEAITPLRMVDYTQYFPGWKVYIDQIKTPIQFQDQNWRGIITFQVPAGIHSVRVAFEDSKVRFIAKTISIMTLLLIPLIIFLPSIL